MPTYEYACKSCGEHLEVAQRFTDTALTTCPACGGALRKVFSSIGIAFKGPGFYKTDSRGSKGASGATKPKDTPKETSTPAKSSTESAGASTSSAATGAAAS